MSGLLRMCSQEEPGGRGGREEEERKPSKAAVLGSAQPQPDPEAVLVCVTRNMYLPKGKRARLHDHWPQTVYLG